MANPWLDIPVELFCEIFSYLSIRDWIRADGTCRQWRRLLADEGICWSRGLVKLMRVQLLPQERATDDPVGVISTDRPSLDTPIIATIRRDGRWKEIVKVD